MTFAVFNVAKWAGSQARRGTNYVGGGLRGVGKGAFAAGTIGANIYAYGDDYGVGFGAAVGVAGVLPVTGWMVFGAQAGIGLLNMGHQMHKKNRALELGKPVQDNWGTIQTMRQQSMARLTQNRTGAGRVLGNEALRFR